VNKIVFDVDGVLRNLYPVVRRKFGLWSPNNYFDWDKKGINIYDLVKKDYNILVEAKPTRYIKFIQELHEKEAIELWSWQPDDWIPYTRKWLGKYFNKWLPLWLKPDEKFKQLLKEPNTYLVEDNPNFPNYDRVILIDQKYNRNVKAKHRVKNVKELKAKIKEVIND
jgi:phosphoglycolate phosphatase-like HAD superfamily hydrolase